ncbi:hypothetical protein D3C81_1848260 [compost metagenome]
MPALFDGYGISGGIRQLGFLCAAFGHMGNRHVHRCPGQLVLRVAVIRGLPIEPILVPRLQISSNAFVGGNRLGRILTIVRLIDVALQFLPHGSVYPQKPVARLLVPAGRSDILGGLLHQIAQLHGA